MAKNQVNTRMIARLNQHCLLLVGQRNHAAQCDPPAEKVQSNFCNSCCATTALLPSSRSNGALALSGCSRKTAQSARIRRSAEPAFGLACCHTSKPDIGTGGCLLRRHLFRQIASPVPGQMPRRYEMPCRFRGRLGFEPRKQGAETRCAWRSTILV